MIPRAVEVACRELSQLGNALVMYQALCAVRDYLEVLKALLYYPAARASGPEDALRIMSGPVELSVETLGLEERHSRVVFQFKRKVGPRPHWLDAVAAAFSLVHKQLKKKAEKMEKPLDSYFLLLALCGWASKAYRENSQNPLWRVVEGVEPEKEYTFEELAETLRDVPQETLRRVWERAEIFYRDEKANGHQLILAALHILMDPDEAEGR
jgi:hypothetical protein